MKLTAFLAVITVVLGLVTGCSTTNSGFRNPDLSKISVGMTKAQVIAALGKPDTAATQSQTEYLEYGWDSPWDGRIAPAEFYYVRLVRGLVESYGRKGDFDSTKNPALDLNVNQKVTTNSKAPAANGEMQGDLFTRLKKLQTLKDDGLITAEEYEQLRRKAVAEAK